MRNLKEYTRNTAIPKARALTLGELNELRIMSKAPLCDDTLKAFVLAYTAGYESGRRSCGKRSKVQNTSMSE